MRDELANVTTMEFISAETISAVDMLDPLALTRYQYWAHTIRPERIGGYTCFKSKTRWCAINGVVVDTPGLSWRSGSRTPDYSRGGNVWHTGGSSGQECQSHTARVSSWSPIASVIRAWTSAACWTLPSSNRLTGARQGTPDTRPIRGKRCGAVLEYIGPLELLIALPVAR